MLKDLEKVRKARAEKYPTLVEFMEVDVEKGAENKFSYNEVTIIEMFMNQIKIFSAENARKAGSILDAKVEKHYKKIFDLVWLNLLPSCRDGASARTFNFPE